MESLQMRMGQKAYRVITDEDGAEGIYSLYR